jgi:nucleoid-associated protein YgaU
MPPQTVSSALEKMSTKRPSAIPQMAMTKPALINTTGFPPPHPLVPSKSRPSGPHLDHPAIHPNAGKVDGTPLFERAAQRRGRERGESHELHPVGSPETVSVSGRTIRVARGDCLWTLAAEVLDTADPARIDDYWRAIYRVNHRVVGFDPNLLLPGQVLVLPDKATG